MCNAQQLTGKMTYNMWSGKISIDGETIPRGQEASYFSVKDYNAYRRGIAANAVGMGIFVAGYAGYLGSCYAYLIGAGRTSTVETMAYACLVTTIVGPFIKVCGDSSIRKVVGRRNNAQDGGLTLAPTENGLGLVYRF